MLLFYAKIFITSLLLLTHTCITVRIEFTGITVSTVFIFITAYIFSIIHIFWVLRCGPCRLILVCLTVMLLGTSLIRAIRLSGSGSLMHLSVSGV